MSNASAEQLGLPRTTPALSPEEARGKYTTRWTHLAFALTALVALLETTLSGAAPALPLAWSWALGALFIALGTYGIEQLERKPGRWGLVHYFVVMAGLALLSIWMSHGTSWMLSMPLISQLVLYVSVPVASATALGVIGCVLGAWYPGHESQALSSSLGLLAASVFVVAFSALAKREVAWRVRSDQLTERLRQAHRDALDRAAEVAELSAREERTRIARELHDALGHYLSAIHVHLEGARALLSQQPNSAMESVNQAQMLSRQGLDEVRTVVSLMRAPSLPLCEVLEALVRGKHQPQLTVALQVTGNPREVPQEAQHTLVRLAQEALTNVRRHARARRATLHVEFTPNRVRLVVEDDGIGSSRFVPGFGLTGAKERVEALGGSLSAAQEGSRGFVVRAEITA